MRIQVHQILVALERALGADHPDTLTAVGNLAFVLQKQGKLDEAKAMLERVLASRERALGADHPDTLMTVNNLADLLNDTGDAAAAAALLERFDIELYSGESDGESDPSESGAVQLTGA